MILVGVVCFEYNYVSSPTALIIKLRGPQVCAQTALLLGGAPNISGQEETVEYMIKLESLGGLESLRCLD
jgi:hypothetical protein